MQEPVPTLAFGSGRGGKSARSLCAFTAEALEISKEGKGLFEK